MSGAVVSIVHCYYSRGATVSEVLVFPTRVLRACGRCLVHWRKCGCFIFFMYDIVFVLKRDYIKADLLNVVQSEVLSSSGK